MRFFRGEHFLFGLVSLAALGLNSLSIPLFFDSLNILLGGAFTYFILEALGVRYAFLLALLLGVERYLLYGNPVASVFMPLSLSPYIS